MKTFFQLLVRILLLLSVAPPTFANTSKGKDLAAQGNAKGAIPCISCHGPDGEGMAAAGFPQLAGLPASYVEQQLLLYKTKIRDNAVMVPIATALDAAEIKDLSAYFASLKPILSDTNNNEKNGASIATRGLWDRKIPACEQCHGPNGAGAGEVFPPLATQGEVYLLSQLQAFRTDTRKGDPQGMMSVIAKKMTEGEIKAVAAYYGHKQ